MYLVPGAKMMNREEAISEVILYLEGESIKLNNPESHVKAIQELKAGNSLPAFDVLFEEEGRLLDIQYSSESSKDDQKEARERRDRVLIWMPSIV